jgi:hypothetical protein
MLNGGHMKRTKTTGELINKLENAIAIANMRGDVKSAEKFTKALEIAINSTQMPEVLA